MSPLWRDQIRIALSPSQVTLIRLARGWKPRVAEQRVVPCQVATPGESPWRNAQTALESALPEFSGRHADAVVVLSNHFVRYTLVMLSNEIGTANEEQALMRHSFTRIYGDVAEHWALRLSDPTGGEGWRVASAVDQDFHESLRALFLPTKLKLVSIQPYLMVAFNHWRHRFNDSAWFALVEQGRLCLAKFHHNEWHSIKVFNIGEEWFRDLVLQLDRERFLSGCQSTDTTESAAKVPVFMFASGCSRPIPEQAQEHSFRLLCPAPSPGDTDKAEPPYAMALIG